MKRKSFLDFLGAVRPLPFFAALFGYQLLLAFQGFTLHDEGSYATFYQQIFSDPESVQFNFMYWFSGMVGGAWMYLFPDAGLFGLRLAGAIITTLTIVVVFQTLKRYLHPAYLRLGLLIALIAMNNDPKEMHYNTLSALFYVSAANLLFTGLRDNKWWKLLLCGALLAVNMFTRVPNLLGFGLVVIVFCHGFLNKTRLALQLKQAVFFAAGFLISAAGLVLVMKMLGHFTVFQNAAELLSKMGKSDKGLYNIMTLFGIFIKNYIISIRNIVLVFLLLALATSGGNFKLPAGYYLRLGRWTAIIKYAILLGLVFLVVTRKIDNFTLLYLQTGFAITAALLLLFTSQDKNLLILTLTGCFIMVVYPLGSNDGILTAGLYSFWFIFPIAFHYWGQMADIRTQAAIKHGGKDHLFAISIEERQLGKIKKYGVLLAVLLCLFCVYFYPHFDKHNRVGMRYSIDHKYLRGVYTVKGRADAFGVLLKETEKYVKKGDYLLAYDCIPMLNYLTETRPYMRNSWPWLYESSIFQEELQRAEQEKTVLPVVVTQIVKTMGSGGYWPDVNPENSLNWEVNQERNKALNDFLQRNGYREVWNNSFFVIWLPPAIKPGEN